MYIYNECYDQSEETKTKTRLKKQIKKLHSTINKKNKSNKLLPKIDIEPDWLGIKIFPLYLVRPAT